MSSLYIPHKNDTDNKSPPNRLLPVFYTFCNNTWGPDLWTDLLENPTFNQLIHHYLPKYGDLVFKEVCDQVATTTKTVIKDLLKDFSDFLNKYY